MGRALASLIFVVALAAPTTASADVFKLSGEVHAGGMYGTGVAGTRKDDAFFAKSPNALYGFQIGAEFLFFDAWIQHHQYTDGSRLTTWTQFGLGIHNVMDLGDEKQRKAGKGGYLEFGGGLFFGIGTGQQVVTPLDNAQLSDKGFTLEARLGFGTHLNKNFDLGLAIPVSYGYFFKTGNGLTANDTDTNYRSIQAEGLLVLRGKVALF
jgi:hypothetical protein